ncbi:hypothetical protein QOT17_012232 [Balamuthia mandrillaris]
MMDHQTTLQMAKDIAVGMSQLHPEGHDASFIASLPLATFFGLSRLKRDTESEEQTTQCEVGPLMVSLMLNIKECLRWTSLMCV